MIAATSVILFLSLGILVIKQNPARRIGWVFALICITMANYYFTSLFLFPSDTFNPTIIPIPLRVKWAFISFSSALFLHLVSYYYQENFRSKILKILPFAYIISFLFFLLSLLSKTIISGALYRGPYSIIGPVPGSLLPIYLLYLGIIVLFGTGGLLYSYFKKTSNLVRYQIQLILLPIAFLIISIAVNSILIINSNTGEIDHYFGDISFMISGFLFAKAVLHFGAVTGRPVFFGDIIRSILLGSLAAIILFFSTKADLFLTEVFGFSFPLSTLIAFIIIIFMFPILWSLFGHLIKNLNMGKPLDTVEVLADKLKVDLNQDAMKIFVQLLTDFMHLDGVAIAEVERGPVSYFIIKARYGNLNLSINQKIPVTEQQLLDHPYIINGPFDHQNSNFANLGIGLIYPIHSFLSKLNWIDYLLLGNQTNESAFSASDLMKISKLIKSFQTFYGNNITRYWNGTKTAAINLPATGIAIQLLGELQIWRNGVRIEDKEWGGDLNRYLLAYLLWKAPQGVAREEIIEFLWPETSSQLTANRFHVALHHLRNLLDPGAQGSKESNIIVYEGGRYRFNIGNAWLDVDQFERLTRSNSLKDWQEAVALYQGAYLQNLTWQFPIDVEIQRQMLENKFIKTLKKCIVAVQPDESILYLQKLTAKEPGNHEIQRKLIQYYLDRGMNDQAIHSVTLWQKAVLEFDIPTPVEILELWAQIRKNISKTGKN
jgi:DNA-binding SARP family transcriptional activator